LLSIDERHVGNITILDLDGRITLGEGAVQLRNAIKELLGKGESKIILDMADVSYIDSSGVGELVAANYAIREHSGKMALVTLTQKIHDALQITKLYTVFDVYDTESQALSAFLPRKWANCPVCSCVSIPPLLHDETVWCPQLCRASDCGARFTVESVRGSDSVGNVTSVLIGTYAEEYFEILIGPPITVKIVGRLDLFASSAFVGLDRVLSKHRKVLFDLSQMTEADERGRDALVSFVKDAKHGFRAVVSLEGLNNQDSGFFAKNLASFSQKNDAVKALGDESGLTTWTTKITSDL
jgi:anti-sigma B factor antagonist